MARLFSGISNAAREFYTNDEVEGGPVSLVQ